MSGDRPEVLRNCPLCDGNNRHAPPFFIGDSKWILKQCDSCRFIYLENAPPYADLHERYAWEKTYLSESHRRKQQEPFIAFLSARVKTFKARFTKRNKIHSLAKKHFSSGFILDVGCAAGALLGMLKNSRMKDFIPVGIEISDALAQRGNDYLKPMGGYVIHSDALRGLESLQPGSISMVIMSSFLEHELFPVACLKRTYQALSKNGRVLIKVPNFNCVNRKIRREKWCGYRFPDHVNYFTPSTLTAMAVRSGFAVHQCNLFDRLPTSDSLYMVLKRE